MKVLQFCVLLWAFSFCVSVYAEDSQIILKIEDFSKQIQQSFKNRNYIKTKDIDEGHIILSNEKNHSDYSSFSLNFMTKELDLLKGKRIRFRISVKALSSLQCPLTMQMRTYTYPPWKIVISSHTVVIEPSLETWKNFEIETLVPSSGIDGLDFMIGFKANAADIKYIFKDPVIYSAERKITYESGKRIFINSRPPPENPFQVIQGGKTAATIVISPTPTKSVKLAVKELNSYIKKSTGTELPVISDGEKYNGAAIHIGETSLTKSLGVAPSFLPPDNWIIARVDNVLILSGGENNLNLDPDSTLHAPFGTLYAVYEFLERYVGVRWYWPGESGCVYPCLKDIKINESFLSGSPSYELRFVWYRTPDEPSLTPSEINLWWRRQRWGGVHGNPIANHSFINWPERFGKSHPEYFAQQPDGKTLHYKTTYPGHLCLSNPDVLKQTIQDAQNFFDQTKWNYYFSVMPGDALDNYYCRCKKCSIQYNFTRKEMGTFSNYVWSFVNKVASETRVKHPDKWISAGAYGGYDELPDFLLEPNIAVTICYAVPTRIWDPEFKKNYVSLLKGWQKSGAAALFVWDYWDAQRRRPGNWGAPTIFPNIIKETYLLDCNLIKGRVIELCEVSHDGSEGNKWRNCMYDYLNIYVAMRLLWDMNTDINSLMNQYFSDLYGPGAKWVKLFYERMEAAYLDPSNKGKTSGDDWYNWETVWLKVYPPDFVTEVMGYLRKAEEITRGHEPYHTRVKKTLEGFIPFEHSSKKYSKITSASSRSITPQFTKSVPTIDGIMNDQCWIQASTASNFSTTANYTMNTDTEFSFLHDEYNIYIGIKATFPEGSKLRLETLNNSHFIFQNESCELFISDGKSKYQMVFSPNGDMWGVFQEDCSVDTDFRKLPKWDLKKIKSASTIHTKEWITEIAIPKEAIKFKSVIDKTSWRVNFCRNFYRQTDNGIWKAENSSWSPTVSFSDINRFGWMFLLKN